MTEEQLDKMQWEIMDGLEADNYLADNTLSKLVNEAKHMILELDRLRSLESLAVKLTEAYNIDQVADELLEFAKAWREKYGDLK